MLRRLITFAVVAIVIGLAAWALWPKPIAVETAEIGKQTVTVTVSEEGKSRIREVFTVSAPIAGQMERIDLHAGDTVSAENVVATLRPTRPALLDPRTRSVAEATAAAARSAVGLAQAQLTQALSQEDFMRTELTRAAALLRRGNTYGPAYEKAKLDVDTAAAAVESARASLAMQRQEWESAEAALGEGKNGEAGCCVEIRAPVSGLVLQVLSESEQVVQPGTPIMEIGDPSGMEIVTELLSQDAVRIAPGATAKISGWGGEALDATVSKIDPLARTKVSALGIEEQRVEVVLELTAPQEARDGLGHGFRVNVEIEMWRGDNLLAVPIGALFRNGQDWACYVADNGVAKLRHLKLGQRNDSVAEVAEGLAAGERVILHPSDQLSDGRRIAAE